MCNAKEPSRNAAKYHPYPAVDLENRAWPGRVIERAPAWCSVDLRDGNQALSVPMSLDEKIRMFSFLVKTGFKEIEVGFPSASAVEYEFVRALIERDLIPEDVTIQVLTQAREHLIRSTVASLKGARKAIIHVYNSTSPVQREVVFGKNREEVTGVAVEGVRLIRELVSDAGIADPRLEYSPESFTATELDYALEICHAVMDVWQPAPGREIILNLPSTVEMSTPNVFADRIEWFCRRVRGRSCVIISVHPHNDRGTAVAAAELAVMAGADRVEGSLFGNGERCGNLDIITMAMNLFSRGIDPCLDFTDIDAVRNTYTGCTRMPIHPRHPYAGDLVYTAFSGSHQDAISKGMKAYAKKKDKAWDVPYLPIDPADVGRTYEAIIRINSQSGKGGVAYIMETEYGIQIPKWMQPEFGRVIQKITDGTGRELKNTEIRDCFEKTYLGTGGAYRLEKCHCDMNGGARVAAEVVGPDGAMTFEAEGNGPLDAFVKGFRKAAGLTFTLDHYAEHALSEGSDARAIAFAGIRDQKGVAWCGSGTDANIGTASIKAVLSAVNRTED